MNYTASNIKEYHIVQNFGGGKFWGILSKPAKIFPAKFLNVTMYTVHDKPVVLDSPSQLYV